MGVRGKLACFCLSVVSPEDDEHATSSEWSAMTSCGHVWHTRCVQKWNRQNPYAPKCPLRCSSRNVSFRPHGSQRYAYDMVRLYFEDDVTSDGFESQLGPSQAAAGQLHQREGVNALERGRRMFGLDFGDAEVGASNGALGARNGDEREDDDGMIEDDDDPDPGAQAARRNESNLGDVARLRRELRETQATVRELRAMRDDFDRQAHTIDELSAEIQAQNETILGLEEELDAREEQIEQWRLNQPDVKERVRELEHALECVRNELEESSKSIERLELQVRDGEARRDRAEAKVLELKNRMHEAMIKWNEEKSRMRAALALRGKEGEQMIKKLQDEAATHEQSIFDMRLAQDRAQHKADEIVAECQRVTAKRLERAEEKVKQAVAEQKQAQNETKKLKDQVHRLEAALKSWEFKCIKMRTKYEELKKRRPAAAISDDEDDARPSRGSPTPRARMPRSPASPETRLPFRIKNTTSLSNLLIEPSPSPPPKKKPKRSVEVLNISSDEEALDLRSPQISRRRFSGEDSDLDDDVSSLSPPRRSNARFAPSLSPARAPVASTSRQTLPLPTMADPTSASFYKLSDDKKLSKLKSDQHLPDFAKGTTELGPKSRKRYGK